MPVAHAGEPARPKSVPLELADGELWLSMSAVGYEEGTVYAFRDLTEERALESMRQDLVATYLRTPLVAAERDLLHVLDLHLRVLPRFRLVFPCFFVYLPARFSAVSSRKRCLSTV